MDFPRGGAESGKKAKTGTKRESSTALYGVGKKVSSRFILYTNFFYRE